MKETYHDYQNCLCGNAHDGRYNGTYSSWLDFKNNHLGFTGDDFDDTYNFVFRYDVHKINENYTLELCIMYQRKGIYTHLNINNITQEELDNEVEPWIDKRHEYIKKLWDK